MSPSDSNLQFHLFRELPSELRELIWKFSLRRTVRVQLQLEARGIPTLSTEHVRGLCTFSYKNNTVPTALRVCKESRQIATSTYDCFPPQAISNRIHPPNLYYYPLYDDIHIEGGAALLEYTKLFGLRPLDMKTFAMHIGAFAASQFPGPPMKVYWSWQQTIDRANGTSERAFKPTCRTKLHRVRRNKRAVSFWTFRRSSVTGSASCIPSCPCQEPVPYLHWRRIEEL
ncbi:hypothetical protein ONS95_013652 [Cadophora gregata]|uniref:uncharacterized protein n=1 Tax=Cadophora gregata TaxID=51156 RepID=UPI0026DAF2B2|nr:uncharacterized protein ONS95_013652 [Cadophora gregata]KAK0114150.1 hypothetical protein ONS95_013652 [Cadophora gregata]